MAGKTAKTGKNPEDLDKVHKKYPETLAAAQQTDAKSRKMRMMPTKETNHRSIF